MPDSNLAGSPCAAVYDPTAPGKQPLQKTPWGVLGLSQADFTSMFGAPDTTSVQIDDPSCSPNKVYKYYGSPSGIRFNNASACSNYSGILVIHNPGFDADLWEANCDTAAKMTSAYCSNAANKPAVFDMNGNVSWTGIVIADQVVKVNGTPLIRGGIISSPPAGSSIRTSPATSRSSTAARRSPGRPTRGTRRGSAGTGSIRAPVRERGGATITPPQRRELSR